jgi:8-oxo-(d)GTP phosphatase
VIRAAGGVLWRQRGGRREVAVVHRPRYDDWSLPKGKLQQDEPHLLAAVREVEEETGYCSVAGTGLGSTSYVVDGGPKTVRWWSLQADDGEFVPNDEVDELRWVDVDEAMSMVREHEPLQRWSQLPADAGLVLLVRHASAGSAEAWHGPDDARPLDRRGVEQAAQLLRVLRVYRPVRIAAAPPVRCHDTVAPLASALGLPVEREPLIGEVGAPADPYRVVLAAASPGKAAVLCSQGGVIPRVIEALAPQRAPVRAAKGSVWALTVTNGRAVAADDTVMA